MTLIWPKPNRSVGLLDALGIIGLLGLLTARFIPVARLIPFWGCGFRQMTGYPCPGCGLTRVADHFAHLHFKAAFMANPLGFIAASLFALAVVFTVLHLAFKVTLPELHLDEREWVWLRNGLIGAVVVNYAFVIAVHRLGPLFLTWALWLALGYLAGSIPFGVLVTRWRTGKDVRAHGSGNIGATNVARVAGRTLGAVVLALDAAKAAVPVLLVQRLVPAEPWLHVAVGASAFAGHVFPVWLKFQGGKGVATALGALAVLLPVSALAGFAVWLTVLLIFRISSVGSLLGALVAVGLAFFQAVPQPYPWLAVALTVAMLWTHRGNIQRLLSRSENKV